MNYKYLHRELRKNTIMYCFFKTWSFQETAFCHIAEIVHMSFNLSPSYAGSFNLTNIAISTPLFTFTKSYWNIDFNNFVVFVGNPSSVRTTVVTLIQWSIVLELFWNYWSQLHYGCQRPAISKVSCTLFNDLRGIVWQQKKCP